MLYLGDFRENSLIYTVYNTTAQSGSSVAPQDDGVIRIYKQDSTLGMNQRTGGLSGITLFPNTGSVELGSGVHTVEIDTSDYSDPGFYETGKDYFIVIDQVLIDGLTVSAVIAQFSIENRTFDMDRIDGNEEAATQLSLGAEGVISGTGFSGPATTTDATITNSEIDADNQVTGRVIIITSGQQKGQAAEITAYVGSTKTMTYDVMPVAPEAGSKWIIV